LPSALVRARLAGMRWGPFSAVSPAVLERVAAGSVVKKFQTGEIVFHQGDPAHTLYVVQSGRFEVEVSTPEAETMQLRIHIPGDHFGEIPLLDSRLTRTGTVRAIEPSTALMVNAEMFAELRRSDPAIDKALIKSLCDLVVMLTQERSDYTFLPTDRRLAKRLLALAEIYSSPTGGEDQPVSIPVTQEHFATAVGSTRPTINRMLGELAAKGVIERSRNRIVIVDRHQLRLLAK
jgi:CRP/FNR family transcriptional regulator, cyclic AMP receptor protein